MRLSLPTGHADNQQLAVVVSRQNQKFGCSEGIGPLSSLVGIETRRNQPSLDSFGMSG
jgi:hypothetical protein